MVPYSPKATPTVQITTYFQAASSAGRVPVHSHQECRAERGRFDRNPHHDDAVGYHRQQHGEQEEMKESVIGRQPPRIQFAGLQVMPRVADGIKPRQEADQPHDDHEDRAQRVHPQPVVKCRYLSEPPARAPPRSSQAPAPQRRSAGARSPSPALHVRPMRLTASGAAEAINGMTRSQTRIADSMLPLPIP